MPNGVYWIRHHAAHTPDAPAIAGNDLALSYAQLRDASANASVELRGLGIERGDRVLLIAPSVPNFAVYYFALQMIGAVAITSNTMSTVPELEYVIDDAECSVVLAWHQTADNARRAAESRGLTFHEIGPDVDLESSTVDPVPLADDDTAVILYTSGTTGKPKGAQLTYGNFESAAKAFNEVLEVTPGFRFGTGLPLFHVFGQAAVMATVLRAGAGLWMLPAFDPVKLMELVRDQKITVLSGVPTMWNAMLHSPADFGPDDFASLEIATSGGASLPGEVIKQFKDRFGCVILEGYGLSETTGAATFNGLHRERKAGYVGIPLPGLAVAVRDKDGTDLPAGEPGEVHIRGPVVMKSYWKNDEATAAVLDSEGWFATGDVGILDEDGDLKLVDRTKDLIIRGGYNIYPREVEEVIWEHPDVVEVAVIGVPHESMGEEVAAVLVLKEGASLEKDTFRLWAKERLSAYKVPRLFAVVDDLPKGATGKILKRGIDRSIITEDTRKDG